MKVAHLADLHLGYRQYHRQSPRGINQREADVAAAFRRAIDGVIAEEPNLVLIAGDLFHSVRPTNPAILLAFTQIRRLRMALPDSPVVIIAGNHDTPRSVETGSIMKLFEAVDGVRVFSEEAQHLRFEDLDLSIFCVPHSALLRTARPTLLPERGTSLNILLTHIEVAGLIPTNAAALEHGGAVVEPDELRAECWDYVALGHYHVAHQVAQNAWYSGSLDYVSSNPWGELKDEALAGRAGQKGWLLVELGDGARIEFRPVELARRVVDLPPIHGSGLTATELDALISERVSSIPGGVDHQIVRQLVYDVPRVVARELDHGQIREFKSRAVHYHVDIRRPESQRAVGIGAPVTPRTLSDVVTDYLSRRPLIAGVNRERLIALGARYMMASEEVEGGE